jgi:hypothetical protein
VLNGFADSDWPRCSDTIKSIIDYCVLALHLFLGSLRSKTQFLDLQLKHNIGL